MKEIIGLLNEMSPYLLLGFLLAGLMHAFIPGSVYSRYLGKNRFLSVVYAALLGIPLPLCSCGVIPTAMSLRREGASKGATVSFLIATPQTGVDSIFATYSLMGLPFAIIRPIAALVTALFGGEIVNLWGGKDRTPPIQQEPAGKASQPLLSVSFLGRIRIALHYGFVDMMQDIGKWLVIGLVIAGLITVWVPQSFFALFSDNSLLSILIVLLFSIPMYICATGSIPIAVALMLKGLSPGAALVLLMAGPASNAASILVINKVMGRRTLILYLMAIVGGAILFGLGIDYLLPREWFVEPLKQIAASCSMGTHYFKGACSILLILLLCYAAFLRYRKPKSCSCDASPEATPSNHKNDMYIIKGMHCNHCRESVEKAIASIDGVESVTVDLTTGKATIKGNVTKEAVRKAVESIGFSLE